MAEQVPGVMGTSRVPMGRAGGTEMSRSSPKSPG